MSGGKRSVNLSAADIQEAWQEVKSDASEDNWILLTYGENNEIVLAGKGAGGLAKMKSQLSSSQVYFGVLRALAVDDHGSKRAKFIFITFVGEGVTPIRRARVSTHKSEFEKFFNNCHTQQYATSEDDLSEEILTDTLNACSGAHKPKEYIFT